MRARNLACNADLILVNAVAAARVNAGDHLGAKRAHHRIRLVHAPNRDVRIALAAPEQDWHSLKRPSTRRRRRDRVADQAATEADDGPEALRAPPDELEREAGALREADQGNPLGWNPVRGKPVQEIAEYGKRRAEVGLVHLDRLDKAMRVPGVPRRLWREPNGLRRGDELGEPEHLVRAPAAAMH